MSTLLRVQINLGDDNHARVTTLDGNMVVGDTSLDGFYENVAALPQWMQGKIAVLSICERTVGLAGKTEVIEGVGQRISDKIFWLEYTENVRL